MTTGKDPHSLNTAIGPNNILQFHNMIRTYITSLTFNNE